MYPTTSIVRTVDGCAKLMLLPIANRHIHRSAVELRIYALITSTRISEMPYGALCPFLRAAWESTQQKCLVHFWWHAFLTVRYPSVDTRTVAFVRAVIVDSTPVRFSTGKPEEPEATKEEANGCFMEQGRGGGAWSAQPGPSAGTRIHRSMKLERTYKQYLSFEKRLLLYAVSTQHWKSMAAFLSQSDRHT